jgi:hypothetical protein
MKKTRKHMVVLLLAVISLAAAGLGFPTALVLAWTRSVAAVVSQMHLKRSVPHGGIRQHVLQAYSKLPLHFEANLVSRL